MYLHDWYQSLFEQISDIEAEAAAFAEAEGLTAYAGGIGTYQGSSGCPGRLPSYVLDPIVEANKVDVLPAVEIADKMRALVKDVYGDSYDVCVTNTAEASLRVAFETLVAPPTLRRGEQYRSRSLQIYGEDAEWGGGYGRAFPPKYRHFAMDRTVSGGELGIDGKSLANLDTLFVRAPGVRYELHGVRQNTVALMTELDVDSTMGALTKAAERHASMLAAVHAVGYDTPGWGFGEKDADGTPVLMAKMADIARDFDVPYILDCATCLPFVGLDPRAIDADIMIYSMDKAGRAPIGGLMIGKSEPMNAIRKAMGWIGPRSGGVSSYSKGVFSMHDPGRDSLVGLYAFLKMMVDNSAKVTDPVDGMHTILMEELEAFPSKRLADGFLVTKSYHMGGLELNYAGTWKDGERGLPLFNLEDMYCGANTIDAALMAMGQAGATIYGGNVLIGPGLGLIDEHGDLRPDATRACFKGLVKAFEITARRAGLLD
ncbi:hypothetical protein ABWH92_06185 [Ahrensia marina]|uniref:hypothetical protein n=1 Tax=Ahrensia marina TaxID=1514904 RepID=UPI0035D04D2B